MNKERDARREADFRARISAVSDEKYKAGVSWQRQCRELGLATGALHNYRGGRSGIPHGVTLRLLALYYGCTVEFLTGESPQRKPREGSNDWPAARGFELMGEIRAELFDSKPGERERILKAGEIATPISIELPKDAGGKPIHAGDTLKAATSGTWKKVSYLAFDGERWAAEEMKSLPPTFIDSFENWRVAKRPKAADVLASYGLTVDSLAQLIEALKGAE